VTTRVHDNAVAPIRAAAYIRLTTARYGGGHIKDVVVLSVTYSDGNKSVAG